MKLFKKPTIQEKLTIVNFLPMPARVRAKIKKEVSLGFGIGEAIVVALGLALTETLVTIGGVAITGAVIATAINVVLSVAVSLGVSLALSALADKPSGRTIANNGRQFNMKSPTGAIPIPYGECKLGGNWVFCDPSKAQNRGLNIAITWAEGEVEGVAKDIDEKPFHYNTLNAPAAKNDLMIRGIYSGVTNRYRVKIDTGGAVDPNTFRWSDDGGASWEATGVAMSGLWQLLNNGVYIKFLSTVGHNAYSYWEFFGGDGIWLGDRLINFAQNFSMFPSIPALEQSYANHTLHEGASDQVLDATLAAAEPTFDSLMRNTAWSRFQLIWNDYLWNSIPQLRITLKGLKIYDPRTTTSVYSRNPALVWLDMMTNLRYGMGIPIARINLDSVEDVANWCDANSFYFDGVFVDRMAFADHMEDILNNFRAYVTRTNGIYSLHVYADDAAVMSINDDEIDFEKGIEIHQPGIPESPNKVRVVYIDRAKHSSVGYAEYYEQAVLDAATVEQLAEVPLVGTSSYLQAKKLAKFFYMRAKYSKTYSAICHPKTVALEPGDMVNVTSEYMGWTDQKVRVIRIGIPQDGMIPIVFGQENAAIYDQTVNIVNDEDQVWVSPLGDSTADPPTNLVVGATGLDEGTTNKFDTYQELTWDCPITGLDFVLAYRKSGVTNWTLVSVKNAPDVSGTITYRLGGLQLNTTYNWQVRNVIGKSLSVYTSGADFTTYSDTECDISGVSLSVTVRIGKVTLIWTGISAALRAQVLKWSIWRNTVEEVETAVQIAEVADRDTAQGSYVDPSSTARASYYYWIKGHDRSGNVSDFSNAAGLNVTVQSSEFTLDQVTSDPVLDGTITLQAVVVALDDFDNEDNAFEADCCKSYNANTTTYTDEVVDINDADANDVALPPT